MKPHQTFLGSRIFSSWAQGRWVPVSSVQISSKQLQSKKSCLPRDRPILRRQRPLHLCHPSRRVADCAEQGAGAHSRQPHSPAAAEDGRRGGGRVDTQSNHPLHEVLHLEWRQWEKHHQPTADHRGHSRGAGAEADALQESQVGGGDFVAFFLLLLEIFFFNPTLFSQSSQFARNSSVIVASCSASLPRDEVSRYFEAKERFAGKREDS